MDNPTPDTYASGNPAAGSQTPHHSQAHAYPDVGTTDDPRFEAGSYLSAEHGPSRLPYDNARRGSYAAIDPAAVAGPRAAAVLLLNLHVLRRIG